MPSTPHSGTSATMPAGIGLDLLLLLVGLRIVNALTLRTFFQPDEYYQSLEPAWQLAFGPNAGAWITWEWRTQLRSSIHPAIFAVVYRLADGVAKVAGVVETGARRSELLLAAPKVLQAGFAGLCDWYSWRLAQSIYGDKHRAAKATLILSLLSPWNWFCSTRTLSNSLETTITVAALYHWPWQTIFTTRPTPSQSKPPTQPNDLLLHDADTIRLRVALLLAAVACVLRPTNLLIWMSVASATLLRTTNPARLRLVRDSILCGTSILALSGVSDRLYYGVWTIPPLRFIHFNIAQSLAVFYGRNRSDYYLTEGLPLLLTTALPFAAVGLYWAFWRQPYHESSTVPEASQQRHAESTFRARPHAQNVLTTLAYTAVFVTAILSLIRHKEVRFLHPILPILHVLAAGPLAVFSTPDVSPTSSPNAEKSLWLTRKLALTVLAVLSVAVSILATQFHQTAVISVLHYLRGQHTPTNPVSVAFLMPCHSTPWRSHLIYADIDAWALTCEPPIDVPLDQRAEYMDEADVFYENVQWWLGENMSERGLPKYLVFFELLEDEIKLWNKRGNFGYGECWRGWNSAFHDDWRRVGDVAVWCREKNG